MHPCLTDQNRQIVLIAPLFNNLVFNPDTIFDIRILILLILDTVLVAVLFSAGAGAVENHHLAAQPVTYGSPGFSPILRVGKPGFVIELIINCNLRCLTVEIQFQIFIFRNQLKSIQAGINSS